jgi:nucleoside recognition membrane protein YjiH
MSIVIMVFEVMDKEPSLVQLLLITLTFAVGGFYLCRKKRAFAFIIIPVALLLSIGPLFELTDPQVGPATIREAGLSYVVWVCLSILLCCAGPLAGVYQGKPRSG